MTSTKTRLESADSDARLADPILYGRQIAFLHIPKTGGVTVRELLLSRFAANDVFQVGHPDDLMTLSDEQLNAYGLVTGHFPWSHLLPRLSKKPILLTFLRDPIDRLLSFFYYIKEQRENFDRWVPRPNLVRTLHEVSRMDIEEFARSPERKIQIMRNDRMTQLLGAPIEQVSPEGEEDAERWFAQAISNLESCDFVGLTERLAESACLLSELLLLPVPERIEWRNRTHQRRGVDDLDAETRELLRAANTYDLRLYERACQLHQERWEQWVGHCALERYRRRLRAATASAPDELELAMDQPVRGMGWYQVEQTPEGRTFRWSGARASIDAVVRTDRPLRLECAVGNWFHQDAVRGLRVFCNAQPVAVLTSAGRGGWLRLAGDLPAAALKRAEGVLRLTFEVPGTARPRNFKGSVTDERELGFALASLSLKPTSS